MEDKGEIIEIIKSFFLKEKRISSLSLESKIPSEIGNKIDVAFIDGNNLIAISIFNKEILSQVEFRKSFINFVISLSKLFLYINKVYVAIPDFYTIFLRSMLSGSTILNLGVGILEVNIENKKVIELLAPKPHKLSTISSDKGLNEVKELYSGLKIELEKLIKRVEELESRINDIERRIRIPVKARVEQVELHEEVKGAKVIDKELPSFARDNPWLFVLSKRGKEKNV